MKKSFNALVADDEQSHRDALVKLLREWGYNAFEARDGQEAVSICASMPMDIVLLDARMPRMDGYEAQMKIHANSPDAQVIIMTAYSDVDAAVAAMRNGAWDYLVKPLDFARLRITLRNAVNKLDLARENAKLTASLKDAQKRLLLGKSEPMRKLEELINAIAPTEAVVLITGESGTGKELAARAIHDASQRRNGPFVAINCGALTESLLASELFGHEKGAFTGAERKHEGLFMQAKGGSIFLDEVGEMPLAMQIRLLRVLQEREILSVGGSKPVPVDCRVLAATNRDLAEEVKAGRFREDLYYRLNVVPVAMPPLRARKEDIPVLASHFAHKFAAANNRVFTGISADALSLLQAWRWPGNVRELENVMERAIILMPGECIDARALPERMRSSESEGGAGINNYGYCRLDAEGALPTLEQVERKVILETLRRLGNNKSEAARALGITRKTLHAKLNRYREIDSDKEFKPDYPGC